MSITEVATITSKGQVTIPKRIRDTLALEAGVQLQFVVTDDGELYVTRQGDPMEQLRAIRDELAPLDVDVQALRRQSKGAWSSVDER